MCARKTRNEISQWMTAELRKQPECTGAEASVLYELQEPGPGGCNWSEDVIVSAGTGDPDDVVRRLRPIHRLGRELFNLGES